MSQRIEVKPLPTPGRPRRAIVYGGPAERDHSTAHGVWDSPEDAALWDTDSHSDTMRALARAYIAWANAGADS